MQPKNIICTWHRDCNHGSLVDKSWLIRRKRKIETWLLCQCVVSNLYAGSSLSETKKQPWPLHFNRHIRLVGSWTRRGCKLFTRFTRYYVVTSNLISDTNQNGPTSLWRINAFERLKPEFHIHPFTFILLSEE